MQTAALLLLVAVACVPAHAQKFNLTLRAAVASKDSPNQCNGGDVKLEWEGDEDGPCSHKELKDGRAFVILSPKNEVADCEGSFSSEAPGMMFMRLKKINLGEDETLTYTGPLGLTRSFSNDDQVNENYFVPSLFGKFEFNGAEAQKKGAAFSIFGGIRATNCHRVIYVPAGVQGRITTPQFDKNPRNLKANTMCQWWIVAPEGKTVTLQFNGFDIGAEDFDGAVGKDDQCTGDFIGIDKDGMKDFTGESQKLCGAVEPADITSNGNMINIMAYAAEGGAGKGFCCTYQASD